MRLPTVTAEEIHSADALSLLIHAQTEERIFELEREVAKIYIHPHTWEEIELDAGDRATYNHFQGVLVIRDTRMNRGAVAFAWKKPA